MSHVSEPRIRCVECGRQSDDAALTVPGRFNFRYQYRAIEPGWSRLTLGVFGFDVCPICINMRFGHLVEEYKRKERL